jgi:hypothetical protein
MPLEATLNSYFSFPTISNNNHADAQTCEMGVTLEPLNLLKPNGNYMCHLL